MSLKVYRAYKLRQPQHFWKTVAYMRQQATEAVRAQLRALYKEWMANIDTTSEVYKKEFEIYGSNPYVVSKYSKTEQRKRADHAARREIVRRIFREGYKQSSVSSERDLFNFDVAITFRELDGEIYVIPYCESLLRDVLDFLDKDKRRFKEYHYQDQSDPPPITEVSTKEWAERKQVWETLSEYKRWPDYLVLDICSWNGWWQVDPGLEVTFEANAKKRAAKK